MTGFCQNLCTFQDWQAACCNLFEAASLLAPPCRWSRYKNPVQMQTETRHWELSTTSPLTDFWTLHFKPVLGRQRIADNPVPWPEIIQGHMTRVSQYPSNFRQTRSGNRFRGFSTLLRICSFLVEAERKMSSSSGCNKITGLKCECMSKSSFTTTTKTGFMKVFFPN